MTTQTQIAQERLESRRWRLRHSAWMLAPLLGFGALSWVGFVYVAARTLRPRYVAIAGFFLVAGAVAGFWPEDAHNTQGGLLLFAWAAAIVTALIINPGYLRWRAMRGLPEVVAPAAQTWAAHPPAPAAPSSPEPASFAAPPSFPPSPDRGPQDTIRPSGQARGPVFGQSGRWETPER